MNVLDKLVELSACLCTAVEESGTRLCWCGVYPGGVPSYDYCGGCEGDGCGMGFVTVDGASLYTTFGQAAGYLPSSCGMGLQLSARIGVVRCMPTNIDGSLPEPDDFTDTTALLLEDMETMRVAATCCYTGGVIMVSYEPIRAQGGCVGGMWRLMLDMVA